MPASICGHRHGGLRGERLAARPVDLHACEVVAIVDVGEEGGEVAAGGRVVPAGSRTQPGRKVTIERLAFRGDEGLAVGRMVGEEGDGRPTRRVGAERPMGIGRGLEHVGETRGLAGVVKPPELFDPAELLDVGAPPRHGRTHEAAR